MRADLVSKVMREMGAKGGKKGGPKGGRARMAALTPAERSELARKASAARWGAKASPKRQQSE